MNEIIIWLILWVVFTEIFYFIAWTQCWFRREDWFSAKVLCMLSSITFLWIQYVIITNGVGAGAVRNYTNLLWEGSIIGGITLWFWLNKLLVKGK